MNERPTQHPTGLGRSSASWHVVACASLALLAACTFANALQNGFVSLDDWCLVEQNPRIRSLEWGNVAAILCRPSARRAWLPLRVLSYAVDYACWGLNPFGYHLTNIVLHVVSVVLVYALAFWVLRRRLTAWVAAAVFAVHPVQVESVTWVSGRRDVLYAMFFLLSLLTFLRSAGGHRHDKLWGWWYGASLICLALSLLSKGSAMTLPAVLVLALALLDRSGEPLWQRLMLCVPHGLIAIVLTSMHFWVARHSQVVPGFAPGDRLASLPWIFATYWRLLFLPVHLSTPHCQPPLTWSSDAGVIALAAIAGLAVPLALWKMGPRRPIVLFALGWWFAMLAPVSNLVPLSMLIAERYLYLALVGPALLAGDLVASLWERRPRLVATCVAVVLALFAIRTHTRNRVWHDSITFWRDGVSKWPHSPVTRIGLASSRLDANRPVLAWKDYLRVLYPQGMSHSENPQHTQMVNAGLLGCYDRVARRYEAEGRTDEALTVYEETVGQMPQQVHPRARLAEAYERRGLYDKAREQLEAIRWRQSGYPGLPEWLQRIDEKRKEKRLIRLKGT